MSTTERYWQQEDAKEDIEHQKGFVIISLIRMKRDSTVEGKGRALPPCPVPGGNLPSWLFMPVMAPEEEKGIASEPATPSSRRFRHVRTASALIRRG
ncbi:hypothetical protein EQ454_22540 [Salmonella enterica subsp. enterica serovar Saintpaul]|nr:hypothetical protein [Salmonella enterica subsp. enterica serovar Saintpaul]MEN57873.1 hypothetical protein [Salmonella enterica]